MKKGWLILLLVLGALKGAYAESIEDYVYQEQPGVSEAVVLNGGGENVVEFTALDGVGFNTRRRPRFPLKIVLAQTGFRALKIYARDFGGNYHFINTTLNFDFKPGRVYTVIVSNVGIRFYFEIRDITAQDGQASVYQYRNSRLADEQSAAVTTEKYTLDAIFYNLKKKDHLDRNALMAMATFNPEDSAAGLFARAMFETSEANKRAGLDQVLQKDKDFWLADYELGKLSFNQRRYDELLDRMTEVVRLNPECGLAYLYQGHALAKLRKYADAEARFAEAAELKNPGAALIMAQLQSKTMDEIFEVYNRPMTSSFYGLFQARAGLAGYADARLASSPEGDFGAALGSDGFLFGTEIGNIGATVKDAELKKIYSDEVYEFGLFVKYQIPIENRFLASVGAGYYLLTTNQPASGDQQQTENFSFKVMAGGQYFLIRNLALSLDLGYRSAAMNFEKQSTSLSGWGFVTSVTQQETVDLSGLFGQIGLNWYLW